MNNIYGYISPYDRNEEMQTAAMIRFGVPNDMIRVEDRSGGDYGRPVYDRLIRQMNPGDTLVISGLGSLGGNYSEIAEQWRIVIEDTGCNIAVVEIPLLDTREKAGNTGKKGFVSELVFQILSYIACEAEDRRELTKQIQSEGIMTAKKRGVKFGRPRIPIPTGYESVKERYARKELSSRSAAEKLGVSQNTFLLWFSNESKH